MVCLQQQFEKLFQFGQKVESLLYTVQPEEVFDIGISFMHSVQKLDKLCYLVLAIYKNNTCILKVTDIKKAMHLDMNMCL